MPLSPLSSCRTAVVVHLHHYNVWPALADRLARLKGTYDLHLTINSQVAEQHGQAILARFPKARLHIMPNNGMDILPFLMLIPLLIEKNYQQVLKLHNKKGNNSVGQRWGEVLLDSLIGHEAAITQADKVFGQYPELALLGPAPFFLSAQKLMMNNSKALAQLSKVLLNQPLPSGDWGFFAGSMFWSRPQAWKALSEWANQHRKLLEVDNYAQDGQWVHAIECLFGLLPRIADQQLGLLHATQTGELPYLQMVSSQQALINQAASMALAKQCECLQKQKALFTSANLLDLKGYRGLLKQSGWGARALEKADLVSHYLLIGQFSGGLKHAPAWAMQCKNRQIPWHALQQQPRVAGLVSIIVPVFNQWMLTRQCVESVIQHSPQGAYELLLVDNGSNAETRQGLMQLENQYPPVRVVRLEQNQFFALGSNLGFAQTKGEFCVFLNNDTQVQPNWLPPLIEPLKKDEVYAVQPQLLYPDRTLQCMGVVFSHKSALGYPIYQGMYPKECEAEKARHFKAITAACMAIKAEDFASMRGFDPIYINGQEDIDLCIRLHKATRKYAAYMPQSKVIHYESKTPGRGQFIDQNRFIFVRRWNNKIPPDDLSQYRADGFEVQAWESEKRKDNRIKIYTPKIQLRKVAEVATKDNHSVLKQANKAFMEGDYDQALALYYELADSNGLWKSILEPNIKASIRRAGSVKNALKEQPNATRKNTTRNESGMLPALAKSYISRHEILDSGFWDEDWYLSQYYDEFDKARKACAGFLSPLDYYMDQGWRLGHTPSKNFSLSISKPIDCNPVTYFLNSLRFEGYHFDENVWIPDEAIVRSYLAQQANRKANKVVYTCITNNYDKLMQPYCLDPEWDYVCFTDSSSLLQEEKVGVWEIRKIEPSNLDYSRLNRWHKINAHGLFPDYAESIYIDGNINIISDYIYRKVRCTKVPIILPDHFVRDCAYAEIKALMASPRTSEENKKLLEKQCAVYEASGFPESYGLTENNVIYRKHHSSVVKHVMEQWWQALCNFSSRDQVSLPYVLWKNDISVSDINIPNVRINFKHFWIVKHAGEHQGSHRLEIDNHLTPVFSGNSNAVVMSCNQGFINYLGVVLASIVENAHADRTYDIIILESDIEDSTKSFIRNAYDHHKNLSIRFYNMRSVLSQLGNLNLHIDGYVPLETYNKIFLSEIMKGYQRVAYIDTDIVVNADIAELCEIELWGKSLGASRNVANVHAAHVDKEIKGRNFREYLADELGVVDYNHYFQAGIIVLDMTSPRVQNLFRLSIKKLRSIRKPVFYDQCIFNSIFYDDVSFFSVGWNHVWYLQNYSYLRGTISERTFFDYARSRLSPQIVHFASKDKPTNKAGWDLAEYFWYYARKSPFYTEILNNATQNVRDEVGKYNVSKSSLSKLRKPRVLVHVHVFYSDQIGYILDALKNINDCDVQFCFTASENFDLVVDVVSTELHGCRFLKVENVGYDVFPFLKVIQESRLSNFDYIIKLHTKNARPESRNKVYGIDVPGYTWRNDLFNAILGTEDIFKRNLQVLENDRSVGAIGAGKYLFSTLENNEEETYNLAEWRAIFDLGDSAKYFGGTMFMARAYPYEKFKQHRFDAIDFAGTKLASGSHKDKAHVFERLFGLVIESERFMLRGV